MSMQATPDPDSCEASRMVELEPESEDDATLRYGWGRIRPKCLQFLNEPKWFLVGICTYTFCQAVAIMGITTLTFSSIEKRFALTGTEVGGIAAANDVSALLVVLFVSFYGDYGNKIKWIGGGGILIGFGMLLYALPHFLIGTYEPRQSGSVGGLCKVGQTSLAPGGCSEESEGRWYYLMIFVVAQIIVGAGISPFYSLVPAYLDENVRPKYMPLYMGVWQCALWLGPGVGLAIGGKFLSIYVDITQPPGATLSPHDPRWIGAWWLGFVIFGLATIISSTVVLGFPRQLPGANRIRQEAMRKGHVRKENNLKAPSLRMLMPELWKLFRNWTFIFNTCGLTMIMMMIGGLVPFLAKSVIMLYGLTGEQAGYALSLMLTPTMTAGVIVGSLIIKCFSLKDICKKAALIIFVAQFMGTVFPCAYLVPGCRQVTLAGFKESMWSNSSTTNRSSAAASQPFLATSCNTRCGCSLARFSPVCGSNNVTYLDACHAGCSARVSEKLFANCSCMAPSTQGTQEGTAKLGYCDRDCKNSAFFALLIGLGVFFGFVCSVPDKTVILRCVPDNKRAFAAGVQYTFVKTLSFLPGPIIFGYIFDSSCLLWQETCGEKGRCFVHDIETLTTRIVIFGLLTFAVALIFYFLSWYLYKPEQEDTRTTVIPEKSSQSQSSKDQSLLACDETKM